MGRAWVAWFIQFCGIYDDIECSQTNPFGIYRSLYTEVYYLTDFDTRLLFMDVIRCAGALREREREKPQRKQKRHTKNRWSDSISTYRQSGCFISGSCLLLFIRCLYGCIQICPRHTTYDTPSHTEWENRQFNNILMISSWNLFLPATQ